MADVVSLEHFCFHRLIRPDTMLILHFYSGDGHALPKRDLYGCSSYESSFERGYCVFKLLSLVGMYLNLHGVLVFLEVLLFTP